MAIHLKIIADCQIPGVPELFGAWGEVVQLPGRAIRPEHLLDADILLVRSIISVNQALLANSRVKFVGSATAGIDHMDTAWLQNANIPYASAKGSNAIAVAEYVVSCIASLRKQGLLQKHKLRAGVIGVGHVGTQVVEKLKTLGFEVIVNDPPRAQQQPDFMSASLAEFHTLDLICLHTPLTTGGDYPTYQLIDKGFLQRQQPGCILLNAGRGEVIKTDDLWQYGRHLIWCFDVWPQEPHIDLNLLRQAQLATPHVAGYTVEAKYRAVFMLYQAAQSALQLPAAAPLLPQLTATADLQLPPALQTWEDVVLAVYNPECDTELTRATLLTCDSSAIGSHFDKLRQHYPERHEFNHVQFIAENVKIPENMKAMLKQLGFGKISV